MIPTNARIKFDFVFILRVGLWTCPDQLLREKDPIEVFLLLIVSPDSDEARRILMMGDETAAIDGERKGYGIGPLCSLITAYFRSII